MVKTKYELQLEEIERIKAKNPNNPINQYLEPSSRPRGKINKNDPNRVNVIKNGKVIASSNNLNVITRYNRKNASIIQMNIDCYDLEVKFEDGAKVNTSFNDTSLLNEWVDDKAKRFGFNVTKKACKKT